MGIFRPLVLLVALVFGLGLQGAQAASARKATIIIPTAASSGTLHPLAIAVADLWNAKLDTVQARIIPSNGGIQNLNLLRSHDAHVSFAVSSITYEALHGLRGFASRPYEGVRVLAGLYYNPNQVVARGASGVSDLRDFRGRRFAPGVLGSTTEIESRVHFAAAGLDYPQDIRAQHAGFDEAIELMRVRRLDGVWIMAGLPTRAVAEMYETANARLVSLSPDVIRKVQIDYPWYAEFVIPAGTYEGQDDDIRTTAVKMLLLTDVSMPEELIYELTRTLWENMESLGSVHSAVHGLTPAVAVTDLSDIPLHPGAAKYYREVGVLKR